MPQHLTFDVLPENRWKPCPRCGLPVPELILSESLRSELDAIGKESVINVVRRLREEGCTYELGLEWAHHHLQRCAAPCTTPCPCCGKFLRTPNAKQCRFCGADWHDDA